MSIPWTGFQLMSRHHGALSCFPGDFTDQDENQIVKQPNVRQKKPN
jgi:hypothetical protein